MVRIDFWLLSWILPKSTAVLWQKTDWVFGRRHISPDMNSCPTGHHFDHHCTAAQWVITKQITISRFQSIHSTFPRSVPWPWNVITDVLEGWLKKIVAPKIRILISMPARSHLLGRSKITHIWPPWSTIFAHCYLPGFKLVTFWAISLTHEQFGNKFTQFQGLVLLPSNGSFLKKKILQSDRQKREKCKKRKTKLGFRPPAPIRYQQCAPMQNNFLFQMFQEGS